MYSTVAAATTTPQESWRVSVVVVCKKNTQHGERALVGCLAFGRSGDDHNDNDIVDGTAVVVD